MTKKVIVSKTIIFIIVIGFISIFKVGFGDENTLIGVSIITAALMLLERDLTISPFKNLLWLLAINLSSGLLSFVADKSIILAFICNFIALFTIGYLFSSELRKPMYVPFGLQYLFMVNTPIEAHQLPMRLASLAFGAVFTILIQIAFNRNKLKSLSEKNIALICDELIKKISLLKQGNSTNICDDNIENLSKEVKRIIYDNRKNNFYITNKGANILNIILSLDRINIILNRYILGDIEYEHNREAGLSEEEIRSLGEIAKELEYIKISIKSKDDIEEKLQEIKENKKTSNLSLYELYNLKENIYENIKEYNEKKSNKVVYEDGDIPEKFKAIYSHKRNFNTRSLKVSYALKIGLLTAISGLIMDYFKLPEGKWIMFTVFSLTQIYSENCTTRSVQRIEATLIGSAIFFVLFTIIQEESLRGLILIAAGYINSYLTDYKQLIICVTISSLGAAAMTTSTDAVVVQRIVYVILGTIISVIANKYILPYDSKQAYKDLLDMYKETVKELSVCIKDKNSAHSIKNLLLIPTFIEDKLLLINSMYKDRRQDRFINEQKKLISDIYDLYINIKKDSVNDEYMIPILKSMHKVSKLNEDEYANVRESIIKTMNSTNYISDKLLCVNLLNIFDESIRIEKIKEL